MTSEELLSNLSGDIAGLSDDARKWFSELSSRTLLLEQKMDAQRFHGGSAGGDIEMPGDMLVASEQFKQFKSMGARNTGKIQVGSFHKSTLLNAIGLNQPLVQAYRRPGIVAAQQQQLRVRDLLPQFAVSSNMVEFSREDAFSNNAAPQYLAGAYEGIAKAESTMTFSLAYAPVQTLAHWLAVSKQLVDDAPALSSYINNRMVYGLKLVEDHQILTGSGINGELSGLVTNATTFDTTPVSTASDSYYDILGLAILQLQKENFSCTGFVMNPVDYWTMVRTKESGTGIASGMYLTGTPNEAPTPIAWGIPIAVTNSMQQGQFLAGDFNVAAAVWDRNEATVEISREHESFFVKNLVAILVEERLALTVFRSKALIYGGWPFGS